MKDTTLQNVIDTVLESVEDQSLHYSLMQVNFVVVNLCMSLIDTD